jgi:hypothetical protein
MRVAIMVRHRRTLGGIENYLLYPYVRRELCEARRRRSSCYNKNKKVYGLEAWILVLLPSILGPISSVIMYRVFKLRANSDSGMGGGKADVEDENDEMEDGNGSKAKDVYTGVQMAKAKKRTHR